MNIIYHVSLGFAQKKDADLLLFGESVHIKFVENPTKVTGCPITAATLDAGNKDFSAKLTATKQGGTTATADKEASREALIALLRQIAGWLEGEASGDVDLITALGFEATSHGPKPQTPLARPDIAALLNLISTQLKMRVTSVKNARAYEVEYRTGTGEWKMAGIYTDSRNIVITGLVPGTLYEFRVRAVGGSTGYSDWSDTATHMAM